VREPLVLPAVEAVDAVPVEHLPALVAGLAALQARAAARLVLSSQRRPVAEGPRPREIDLTQEEAAERFRLPLRTVRFLTRTGRVPSYRCGRRRMIASDDLVRHLEACREQGVAVTKLRDVAVERGRRGGQGRA
jgi:excisionase family DNA binding protein